MKKILLSFAVFMISLISTFAINKNTVEIIYNGTTATVSVASNISSYVTVTSGSSSHVIIKQSEAFEGIDTTLDNEDGEIIYSLSGSSNDGEFYMEGAFKCTVELNGLTLTNPSGPAINIQNGKRIAVSAQKGTVNTLTDGANETYNGCLHIKGHTKMKGKGTLNIVGNSKHGIYSKEYLEIKNMTLNVNTSIKDAIHCKEYFLLESGNISLTGAGDDGIQVELSSDPATSITTEHEEENTGNFYMTAGTLTISDYQGKAIKTDGSITYSGGTRNFNTDDTEIYTGIQSAKQAPTVTFSAIYDLNGRQLNPNASIGKGLYIIRKEGKVIKTLGK